MPRDRDSSNGSGEGGVRKRNLENASLSSSPSPSPSPSPPGLSEFKADLKRQRKATTLLRAPFTTLYVFAQVFAGWVLHGFSFLLTHKLISISLLTVSLAASIAVAVFGYHSEPVLYARGMGWFVVWWVTLGILSSVGLGTGLHTFVLYLGPHIAMVTLAVTECDTMGVLEGPDGNLICPPPGTPRIPVTFLRLLLKVFPAAFLWGAGTAIGELPPYFVSRQARLSGQRLEELDELEEEERGDKPSPSKMDRIKLLLYHALQRWGFWAIVICASVPNPLFDLAGLTCGHFLVPFWTFFGATFLGKAVFKVQLQACFVILAFDKTRLQWIISKIEAMIPAIEGVLHPLFEKQRAQFHGDAKQMDKDGGSWLSFLWNWVLILMLLFFVKSIIESSVQERLAEVDSDRIDVWHRDRGLVRVRKGPNVVTRLAEKRRLEAEAAAAQTASSNKKKQSTE